MNRILCCDSIVIAVLKLTRQSVHTLAGFGNARVGFFRGGHGSPRLGVDGANLSANLSLRGLKVR